MLRSVSSLHRYTIHASDGPIGSVYDALLDDEFWILRYIVVDVGGWLSGRKILLTPGSLGSPDWLQNELPVKLTRKQVEDSPDIDSDKPVSRQHELELYQYFGWPFYWQTPAVAAVGLEPPPFSAAMSPPTLIENQIRKSGDPHLRSVRDLRGYHIVASDGEIGHVEDFIVDDEDWDIRQMVVATRNWLPGRKVLISPHWFIGRISWSERTVHVVMTRDSIRNSPEYDPATPLGSRFEDRLREHYRREGYNISNIRSDGGIARR